MTELRENTMAAAADRGPPDWNQFAEDVICPLCHYQLRGLLEPRCPECGYTFTWPEVLDPRRRLHPYLYEHHPERGALAFRQTMLRTWTPGRFFRQLHPVQPVNRSRLIRYMLIGMAVYLLAFAPLMGLRLITAQKYWRNASAQIEASIRANLSMNPSYREIITAKYGSVEAAIAHELDAYHRQYYQSEILLWQRGPTSFPGLALIMLWPLTLPLLSFLTLMIFQQTMRRARIDRLHVLRAVIYSYDQYALIGMLLMLATAIVWLTLKDISSSDYVRLLHFLNLAFMAVLLFSSLRLSAAYREYLRFPSPRLTVLMAQSIVALFLLTCFATIII